MTALANILAGFSTAGVALSPDAAPATPGAPDGAFAGLLASTLGSEPGSVPLPDSAIASIGLTSPLRPEITAAGPALTAPFQLGDASIRLQSSSAPDQRSLQGNTPLATTGLPGAAIPASGLGDPLLVSNPIQPNLAPVSGEPIAGNPGLSGPVTPQTADTGQQSRVPQTPNPVLPTADALTSGEAARLKGAEAAAQAAAPPTTAKAGDASQVPGAATPANTTTQNRTPTLPVPGASNPAIPDTAGTATLNAQAHLQAVAEATPTGRAGTHLSASPVPPVPVQPATDAPRTTHPAASVTHGSETGPVAKPDPLTTAATPPAPPSLSGPKPSAGFAPTLFGLQESIGDEQAPTVPETGALQSLGSRTSSPLQSSLSAPTQAPQVPVNALAVHIAAQAQNGVKRFEIRLDPPELGRVDVRLDVGRDGQVSTHLIVERAETLDLLQRDAKALEKALNDAGLKTSDDGMTFSLKDEGLGKDQADNDESESGLDPNGDDINEDDNPDGDGRITRSYIATDGLDIRI